MPSTYDVNIKITDELTLTPLAGASLVNEIIKGLLYQKCQIPYPYSWLKQVVENRRKRSESDRKRNFSHESHYRTVSSAYEHLDVVMKGISKEFCQQGEVQEIVVVFGANPICPLEVFTIVFGNIARGHVEGNHLDQLNKHLQKVLRYIFLSQTWMDSIDATPICTNTYIYIKKQISGNNIESEVFERCQPFNVSKHTKHWKFHISYHPSERSYCCSDLEIFSETGDMVKVSDEESGEFDGEVVWIRTRGFIKGFKDCFVDKVSVSELW